MTHAAELNTILSRRPRASYAWTALIAALGIAAISCSALARAQDSGRVQQATRLFDAALENVARGDLEQACRQFDESERLDPQLGTKMHLADCYERQGKLASAWLHFRAAEMLAAERIAGGAVEPREKIARLRAARIQKRMPTLQLVFADPQPDLAVTLDGQPIPARSWGTANPIDPGEHVLRVSAPGHTVWRQNFTIAEQKHQQLQVPELEPEDPQPSAAGVISVPAVTPAKAASIANPASAPAPDTLRIIAYALTGAALIATGTGVALGIATNSTLSERDALCPNNTCRDAQELEQVGKLTADARDTATPANLLMIGGSVALAAGLTWLVFGAKSSESQVSLGFNLSPNAAGLNLQGRGF
jgi:hypothetical protein